MPFTIPPFQQFQAPLIPLRGLWNRRPPEGDRFISAEIDWRTPGIGNCVQFQLSAGVVPISQVAALYVDNARCGSDVSFLFGDSGFVLAVPAYAEGLYPVLTNALMFYASAPSAALADITVVQILNSIPPPIPVQLGPQQQTANVAGVALNTNATTPLIPAPTSGTLNAMTISLSPNSTTAGAANLQLNDGTGRTLWLYHLEVPIGQSNITIPLSNLRLRFQQGLGVIISGSTGITGGFGVFNLYYSVP